MMLVIAVAIGFLLDLILADPLRFPHPVRIMGACIRFYENKIRKRFPDIKKKGEFTAGLFCAVLVPLATFCISSSCIFLLYRLWPPAAFALNVFWAWQCLSAQGLQRMSMRVHDALTKDGIASARQALSHIVGRDTAELSEDGILRAAVETISENFSDGVIAPLFYLMIGGAPLGLAYKAVNTLDSMIGYKNERYLYFGRAAAKSDDAFNFVPARISALLWIAIATPCGFDSKNAFRIWKRDRLAHTSPNSAQTEAACAGALHVQLGGTSAYQGKLVKKPSLGDDDRAIRAGDIPAANRMMLSASVLGLLLFCVLRLIVFVFLFCFL